MYSSHYNSPLGNILLTADALGLTGLYFAPKYPEEQPHPVFSVAAKWLDIYFSGKEPDFKPSLHLIGSPFQLAIWEILLTIPYGETLTYGDVAKKIGPRMSPQAVGGAVGKNPVSIIVPCHRVMGTQNKLTGYAGGIDNKIALLNYEGINTEHFLLPKKMR